MFEITRGSGFHITYANGWTASVQWGPGTYSGNHGLSILADECPPSSTAECLAWREDVDYPADGEPLGYQGPGAVVAFLAEVALLP